jgi:hypothetical protein
MLERFRKVFVQAISKLIHTSSIGRSEWAMQTLSTLKALPLARAVKTVSAVLATDAY